MQQQWDNQRPIYEQLAEQLVTAILDGRLAAGDPIPSVRQLAGELQVNPLTVQRAISQLADQGIVERRRGVGSFVAQQAQMQLRKQARDNFVSHTWPQILEQIRRLELDTAPLIAQMENLNG